MSRDAERPPDPGRRPRRNPRAARLGFRLDYTLGVVLGCLAVAGFVWIAIVVAKGELLPLDTAGLRWARSARSLGTTSAILEITALGSVPTILLVLLLATIFLPSWSRGGRRRGASAEVEGLDDAQGHGVQGHSAQGPGAQGPGAQGPGAQGPGARRRRAQVRSTQVQSAQVQNAQDHGLRSGRQVLLLWLAVIGGAVLNTLLKSYFSRPRPPITTAVYAGYFAFPSGHAMSSMVVYGTLAYLIVRGAPGRSTLQILTIVGAALVIILIGLSRIYLGVHYATDVLGGYLAGLAWADFCVLMYEVGRERRWQGRGGRGS